MGRTATYKHVLWGGQLHKKNMCFGHGEDSYIKNMCFEDSYIKNVLWGGQLHTNMCFGEDSYIQTCASERTATYKHVLRRGQLHTNMCFGEDLGQLHTNMCFGEDSYVQTCASERTATYKHVLRGGIYLDDMTCFQPVPANLLDTLIYASNNFSTLVLH